MKTIMNESQVSLTEVGPMKYRYAAILIDYLCILVYGSVLALISLIFKSLFSGLFSQDPIISQVAGFILITLPVILYFLISEASESMGTIGKRKVGLKVTDEYGQRIKPHTALIRSVVKFLPWEIAHYAIWRLYFPGHSSEGLIMAILIAVNILLVLYIIFPFTNKQRMAIHDWVAKTRVISR